jgi:sporulation protein YlmC with PRC-barrel domain
MSESTSFTIGSAVACSDGACGKLQRVVVDPVARVLTHLVVEPPHRVGAGRLVPIELVETSTEHEIRLRCTRSDFDGLDEAEETRFLPGAGGEWGYGPGQMLSLPYFGLGGMGMGMGIGGVGSLGVGGMGMGGMDPGPHPVVTDRVPLGEVIVRRGDPVTATDGAIGRVQGLVIDPSDHHVTHFLLDEGHLWGQKRVAIPIGAVKEVNEADGVCVSLTKDQVRDLPPVDLDLSE